MACKPKRTPAGPLPTLVLLMVLAAAPLAEAKAVYSKLWGKTGELYDPKGRLPDFSHAGYRFGLADLPKPPVTRPVTDFRARGFSDTQMLKAALDWAHKQPVTNSYTVLYIPPGRYTLLERLYIRRSRLVLRGAGSGKTILNVPKTLTDIYGPNPNDRLGKYVNQEAFISFEGSESRGSRVAAVTKAAAKGDMWITVDSASGLKAGEYIDTWWTDVNGKFNNYMFDNKWVAPTKYKNSMRVKWTSKIAAIQGNRVRLERRLPYAIDARMVKVSLYKPPATVTESGVEGLTFSFKWTLYPGHHLELGYNAVELRSVRDCWVRDIATINADNTVVMNGVQSTTITGVTISTSKTRANNLPNKYNERANADGHWGIEYGHSFDIMVQEIYVKGVIVHSVGTDSSGKWGVFRNMKFYDGNLDLHRALAGPSLYTNIDVGIGTHGLSSGGPVASGPNALAGTTWWNIRSKMAMAPNNKGDCAFGPVINLVGVNLIPAQQRTMCKTWWYERGVNTPVDLYQAQYAARMRPLGR